MSRGEEVSDVSDDGLRGHLKSCGVVGLELRPGDDEGGGDGDELVHCVADRVETG
jgi:hypothetical protein